MTKDKLYKEFKDLTGIDLPKHNTGDPMTDKLLGLDILALDDIIKPPDGTSLSEELTNRFGVRSSDIIREILEQNGGVK